MPHEQDSDCGQAMFTATQWSVVLAARESDPERAQAALEQLCNRYWYPLYAFIRRRGYSPEDAEDLTQAFFAHLLRKQALHLVDRDKGLFRTFLLAVLVNFLNDQRDRQHAAKRGGGKPTISWDELTAEQKYLQEPAESITPEHLFERRWALTLIETALLRLRQEYEASGKLELFRQLEPSLTGNVASGFYDQAAVKLGMNTGAIRVALHRLRRRLGEILRSEVAHTVSQPEEVEEEIRNLFAALG